MRRNLNRPWIAAEDYELLSLADSGKSWTALAAKFKRSVEGVKSRYNGFNTKRRRSSPHVGAPNEVKE